MDAHPDPCTVRADVPPEDLADADLAGPLGSILETDHPECDHVRRVRDGRQPDLEQTVGRRIERLDGSGLPDDEAVRELQLAAAAPDRPGKLPGLQAGHPDPAILLGVPRRLVGIDPQSAPPPPDGIPSARRLARTPVRQIVRKPQTIVEVRPPERLVDLELVSRAIDHPPSRLRRSSLIGRPSASTKRQRTPNSLSRPSPSSSA